jgi:spore coat protein U-like protein
MRKIAFAAAALAATVATPAMAGPNGTVTRTMDVVLNVTTACTMTTSTTMDFGFLTSVTGGTTSTANATVKCTPNAAYTVKIDNGQNFGSGTQRKMKSTTGTATVDYNVFQSDGSTAWPVAGVPGSGTGSDQTLNIVGKLANATEVAAGTYKDLLTITLDY